ncbi:hypothetical protein PVAP13_8KG314222 [Panicum virgatum]|uniref:NB-ARC domain-containing protein n=1 Tax=Panicum virgatum TaxID=38727 RepID=A0A8T0PQS8_PANVG|nr:hypothetical protein PVAP13_8KG314222 [Panicum virgatum]
MQQNLMLISDEFEMMHSFLNDAKDRATDEMVRTLVRQVRNMALDVEDCIEYVVLVDIKSHWNWWRRLLPRALCMLAAAPAEPLDDAVSALELLKSRVEAMGQRNQRYRQIGGSSSTHTEEKTPQQAVTDPTVAGGILIEAREAKKRQGSPSDLVELIKKKEHVLPLQVISLWGATGDLGVTSIIKKTLDSPEICSKFSCRAWVKLTKRFNPHEFIRTLMAQFHTNCCPQQGSTIDFLKQVEEIMGMDRERLTEEFVKQVSENRYIIFLEDLSSSVDWEATVRAYLPDKNNGSCVVVHTQQLQVASLVVGQSHRVLELEQFSADHSVCVFFNEKRSSPRDLIELISMKDKPLQVISMCGEVGDLKVEMARIIEKAYDRNPEICKNFRYRAWVKLMQPLIPREFIQRLLAQFCANYCPRHGSAEDFLKLKGVEMVTEDALIKEFVKQVMSDKRYLVFLEDVSSANGWDAVREYLPDKTNGSCIFVHTQLSEVASSCVGQSHRELELLSANLSLRVFFQRGMYENH